MEKISAGGLLVDAGPLRGLADLQKVKTVAHPNPSRGICVYCKYPILKNQDGLQNLKYKAHRDCYRESGDRTIGDYLGNAPDSPDPSDPSDPSGVPPFPGY